MKYIYFFSLFFCFTAIISAQEVELLAVTQFEVLDTVRFGYNTNASIEIDDNFDENDVSGLPWLGKKLRIYQRDSTDFNCLYDITETDTTEIYFDVNFDSRVNLRGLPVTANNRFFEVEVNGIGIDEEGGLILRSSTESLTELIEKIIVHYGECLFESSIFPLDSSFVLNEINIPVQSTITNNYIRGITIAFRGVSTQTIDVKNSKTLLCFPNPVTEVLNYELPDGFVEDRSLIKVYNSVGQLVLTTTTNSNQLNVNRLTAGIYHLIINDSDNAEVVIGKFVKQ